MCMNDGEVCVLVVLELKKFLGSLFFGWDAELYCPLAEEPAVCNSSDLNEELGQVSPSKRSNLEWLPVETKFFCR